MNWNSWIRQIHRWVSIVFTVTVIANFIALAREGTHAAAVGDLLAAAARSRFSCSPGCICSRCRMPRSGGR